mgnify:CR=1 FL=1
MATRGSEERDRGRERILVVCTRYIGDTVLAIPFLRNLRRAFPDAVIDICAEGPARGVLAGISGLPAALQKRRADSAGWRLGERAMWAHLARNRVRVRDLLR